MKRIIAFIFAFVLILTATCAFVGCGEETPQSEWLIKTVAPTENDRASVGDFWLDSSTSEFYEMTSSGWKKVGSFAEKEESTVWHKGEGEPARSLGKKGDFYLDTKNQVVYQKRNLSWSEVCTLKNDKTTVYVSDYDEDWDEDKTLKILAIGNSFSEDTMEYVYEMAETAHIEKIVIGNLHVGGCSLDLHYSKLVNNSNDYLYYYEDSRIDNEQYTTTSYSANTAIASEDWDFISLQQVSGSSGQASSYTNLENIIQIVKSLCPTAKLVWNMTWAYQSDSTHGSFSKYNNSQKTMYEAIWSTVQTRVVPTNQFTFVAPTGTAIQNARTILGDVLCRDGYHLDKGIGRYIAGLAFFCQLTGIDPFAVTYAPSEVTSAKKTLVQKAVKAAIANPYAVTTIE